MGRIITLSLDGMGGDSGPEMVISGAALALERHPGLHLLIHGDESRLSPLLAARPALAAACEVRHTDAAVAMDDKPGQALRHGRGTSSMWLALESVKSGEAGAVVSAGNTGALMAMAKVLLKTLPGVDRPALAALWPTLSGESVVLDVGATINPGGRQLAHFGVMGAAYARVVLGVDQPTVSLLNVGVEEMKGTDDIKEAARLLRVHELALGMKFDGFIEGDGIGRGLADVVVSDGFTGNIALKTAEGTARQVAGYLRRALRRSPMARVGGFLSRGALRSVEALLNPRALNGGVMLGLNGVVVKSHGGADAEAFAGAMDVAVDVAEAGLADRIARDLSLLEEGDRVAADAALPA